ncbi:MAG: hypothetical protein HY046_05665 [Acidobacteria bacterium]|nr:hypothetical protein [Acidobacteriota bacterium]
MARTLALFLSAVLLCVAAATSRSLQTEDLSAKLNKEVSDYSLGSCNFPGALLQVSKDFQIPMGIVWTNSPAARAEMPFVWKHATVKEIIEGIAKTQPTYQVRIGNGVVHVFPSIPDRENFLKIKIDAFETHNDAVELASFKLHMLVTPIKGGYQISIGGTGDSFVSVALKNCTVEDALDALAGASNRKVWIVAFQDDVALMANGLRRTRSVFTDRPIPDGEQPAWHLQRWGDPVPPLFTERGNNLNGAP